MKWLAHITVSALYDTIFWSTGVDRMIYLPLVIDFGINLWKSEEILWKLKKHFVSNVMETKCVRRFAF